MEQEQQEERPLEKLGSLIPNNSSLSAVDSKLVRGLLLPFTHTGHHGRAQKSLSSGFRCVSTTSSSSKVGICRKLAPCRSKPPGNQPWRLFHG